MTVAAALMVRDEVDIIGSQINYLLGQVDEIFVLDNRSDDGTTEILRGYENVVLIEDREVGYWQERKMSALAQDVMRRGHDWVVPVDADELWVAPHGMTVGGYLTSVSLDVQVVRADIRNHVPTGADDPDEPDPFRRIRWRQPEAQELGKVACRVHDALTIHAGNHAASYRGRPFLAVGGLTIRHFPWRSEAQYVRKIRNGEEAYAATDLHESVGAHWRMWEGQPDEAIEEHFREWFYEQEPPGRHELVYDPVG